MDRPPDESGSGVDTTQRVRFGILCALQVYQDPAWRKWAEGWLSGSDRGEAAAGIAAVWAAEAATLTASARAPEIVAAMAARAASKAASAAEELATAGAEELATWEASQAVELAVKVGDLALPELARQACLD